MKKKPKLKHIYDEVYKQNFYVYYGWKEEDYLKELRKLTDIPKDVSELGRGHCMQLEHLPIITVWTKEKNVSLLAHEVFHASFFVLDKVFGSITYHNDEAFAYYVEMLMRRILEGDKK